MTNRDREMAALSDMARNEALPVRLRRQAVLTIHQRAEIGSCICGWSQIGRSHAEHQAEELEKLGMIPVPAEAVAMTLRHHGPVCECAYNSLADYKLIDSRCIAGYRVPS